MAVSTFVKNFSHGTITLNDGTGTPLTITLDFDNGDLSIDGLQHSLREVAKYERRGSLKSVALTNRVYPTGSFTAMMSQFTDAASGTLADFLGKTAGSAYSAALSTLGANHEVYTVQIVLTVEGTDHGDAADHSYTLDDCRCTLAFAEGDPNTFSIGFEVLGAITGDIPYAEA